MAGSDGSSKFWTGRARDPEREYRIDAFGLGFEWVGVESRGIVLNIQIVRPIEIVVHKSRAEAARTPFLDVLIDSDGLTGKFGACPIKLPIMVKIMDPNFKSVAGEFIPEFTGNEVIAFGNKIKRSTKAKLLVNLHQLATLRQALLAFNIMRQDEREFLALGPARPTLRSMPSGWMDRPRIPKRSTFAYRERSPQSYAQAPWQIGLEFVIETAPRHV